MDQFYLKKSYNPSTMSIHFGGHTYDFPSFLNNRYIMGSKITQGS